MRSQGIHTVLRKSRREKMRSQGIHTVLRKSVAFSEGKIRSQTNPYSVTEISGLFLRKIRAQEIFSVLRKSAEKSVIFGSSVFRVIVNPRSLNTRSGRT